MNYLQELILTHSSLLLLQSLREIDSDINIITGSSDKQPEKHPTESVISKKPKKRRKPLMILGTSSNAGKSIVATAFCRIFYNDGTRVAPFKAQNMSLNSFVTTEGGEMGRAQVLQAQACFLAPDVRMNPILLKPNSQTGSQVIVMGKPVGNMKAAENYKKKQDLWQEVKNAYDSLAREFDLIVLEGAGSPAEVNLKKNDIVNMKMAAYSGASTVLVGDIDRGGVYASLIGTMELFTYKERKLITGYLVNKFRGDSSQLDMAHDYLLKYTGKPVLGIIPMIPDLNLPEEDSVTFKEDFRFKKRKRPETKGKLIIIVVDFPHISNFTDLDALKREKDVYIQIVRSQKEIPDYWDIFILPGSKNVINDLRFLKASGIATYLMKNSHLLPGEVIGICGGFQMLGNVVCDPGSIESTIAKEQGLSLLDMSTTMMKEKVLQQTKAIYIPTAASIKGYEIHHGETISNNLKSIIKNKDRRIIGYSNESGTIWGTYLHSLFDNDEWRNWLLNRYRKNKMNYVSDNNSSHFDLNMEIDRLADIVRHCVNMERIYKDLGI